MKAFVCPRIVSIGEAMLEMAPTGLGVFRQGYAGDTFNTLWHMAQLLGNRATAGFVTRIGADTLSDRFAGEMEDDGLSLSGVMRDPDRHMGLYLIELAGVERSFHYWRRDSAASHLADDPEKLEEALYGAGLIHLSGITLAILSPNTRDSLFRALANARRVGALISFDPNIRPRLWASKLDARETVATMLALTDIALPSFDDEAWLWDDGSPQQTIARMRSHGVLEVIVKNGPGAVAYAVGRERGILETPLVEAICDTSGAGDSFNAGYLASRFAGSSVIEALKAAQSLSAEIIGHFGARAPRHRVREMGTILFGQKA